MRSQIARYLTIIFFLSCSLELSAANLDKDLWEAARKGEEDIVDQLLCRGADPNVSRKNWFPLMFAAFLGNTHMADSLLKAGANPDSANKDQISPLYIAASENYPEIVDILVDSGASTGLRIKKGGWTPLMRASLLGNAEVVKILVDAGADTEMAEAENRDRPLMLAVGSSSIEAVRYLLDGGALVNSTNKIGSTPLMFSAVMGTYEITQTLLEHGADPKMVNNEGDTALSLARKAQKRATFRLLKDFEKGGVEAIRRVDPKKKPFMNIQGMDVWLESPNRLFTKLNNLRAEDRSQIQVLSAQPQEMKAMDLDTLYMMVERHLLFDARQIGADALVINDMTTERHSVNKREPLAEMLIMSTLAGLGGWVYSPGLNVDTFIDTTNVVSASAIQYEVDMTEALAAVENGSIATQEEIRFWESVGNSNSAEKLQLYLDEYPDGYFAELAALRLKIIGERERKAVVFIYRPKDDGNNTEEPPVFVSREDEIQTTLAVMDNGRYIRVELQPGNYTFFSDNEKKPSVEITLECEKTYYMEMDSSSWSAKGCILLVDETKALKEMSKLKALDHKFVQDRRVIF